MLALAETRPRRPIPPLLASAPVLSHTTTTFPNRICATGAVGRPIIFGIEWDAENRVTAINSGTHRSEFTYDGESRRVRIFEKENGVPVTGGDKRYLWCGMAICEQRDGAGTSVQRRFFDQGFQEGTTKYFYARDHLGSVRETTDNAGAIQLRMDYDPYGRPNSTIGNPTWGTFGYTGHLHHWDSGVIFAPYRGYLSAYGRWISEDPIAFGGGDFDLYRYVYDNPTKWIDPNGQGAVPPSPKPTPTPSPSPRPTLPPLPPGGPQGLCFIGPAPSPTPAPQCIGQSLCPCGEVAVFDPSSAGQCLLSGGNVPTIGTAANGQTSQAQRAMVQSATRRITGTAGPPNTGGSPPEYPNGGAGAGAGIAFVTASLPFCANVGYKCVKK